MTPPARHVGRAFRARQGIPALPEIGSQGVVSELLAGKRALDLRQVKALAKRFAVPMGALTA